MDIRAGILKRENDLLPHCRYIAELICRHLPEHGLLVDAGANIGMVTAEVLRKFPQATAVLFEPISHFAEYCRKRFAENPSVTVYQEGLSDHAAAVCIYADRTNLGWNTLDAVYANATKDYFVVDLVRLDDVVIPRIDVLKVDVESWEGKLLRGARETIARDKPVIIMELSRGSSAAMWDEKVIELEYLFSIGYQRINYAIEATTDVVLLPC